MDTEVKEPSLTERLEKIIRPNLRFLDAGAPVDPSRSLGELGLDSLASINLLIDLETEFGIVIPDEEIDENTFASLANLEALVSRALNS